MHRQLVGVVYPDNVRLRRARTQPSLLCVWLGLTFVLLSVLSVAGAWAAVGLPGPSTLPLREACGSSTQPPQSARCLLDDVYRLGQIAARDPAYLAQYQTRAVQVHEMLEGMPAISEALKQEAAFAVTMWGADDEGTGTLLEDTRKAVCAPTVSQHADAAERSVAARCTLVQMLEYFSREEFQQIVQSWEDFSQRASSSEATGWREGDPPDAVGVNAMVRATYATAIAPDEPAKAGSILLESMIRTMEDGPRADYMAATVVAQAASYALSAGAIGDVPLWELEPAIAQVLWITDLHFNTESVVARDLAGSLAGFYARSAEPMYGLPLTIRESAQHKGARLAARLYQTAVNDSDAEVRHVQLKEVVALFEHLGLPEHALEATASLRMEEMGGASTDTAGLEDIGVLIALNNVPGGKAQSLSVARRLVPVLQDMPDETPGLPHALLQVVNVLMVAPPADTPCERRQVYSELRAMNERGRRLTEAFGADNGVVPAHFELQAETLKIGIRAEDALNDCKVSVSIPTEEENLRRKVEQVLAADKSGVEGLSLKSVGILLMQIDQRLDALRGGNAVERSEVPVLYALAQRLFEQTALRVNDDDKGTREDWADLVTDMARLRRNMGDTSGGVALVNDARSALPENPEAQASMAILLGEYPRLLRREEGTFALDQRTVLAVVIAMAELGDTQAAIAGLDQLDDYDKRRGQEAVLYTLLEQHIDASGKAWLATLPDDLYRQWQDRRWRLQASRLEPERVSAWLAEGADRERRWYGILALARHNKYGEIIAALERWQDPVLRESGALVLLEAGQKDGARQLAGHLAPAQQTRFFVESATKDPERRAQWLAEAMDSLLEVSDSPRRMALAADLLCAAAPAASLAPPVVMAPAQRTFLRNQGQGISVSDSLRKLFASCLFVFGEVKDARSIIKQIGKPEDRVDAYLNVASEFATRGNRDAAKQALLSAQQELKGLEGVTFRFGVQRLYRSWVLAAGLDDAYADAKKRFSVDPKGDEVANAANRATLESAVEGLIEGALEVETVPVIAELLASVRDVLGPAKIRALAIQTLDNVSRQDEHRQVALSLIPLVENSGFDVLDNSDFERYVLALGRLGDAERASKLAARTTERRQRAELQAALAERLQEAGVPAPEIAELAREALRSAKEIDVGSAKLKGLATVARHAAKAGVDDVARSALDQMVSARRLVASANEMLAEAFSALRQLAPNAQSHRARLQVLHALRAFGKHYLSRRDGLAVQQVLDAVSGYDRYARLAEDVRKIREELTRDGPLLTDQHYQESLRFWQNMARNNPRETLWNLGQIPAHDFIPDALDAGIELFEFGLRLSRQELRKSVADPTPAGAEDPGGLSLVDQRMADKLLLLLAEKNRQQDGGDAEAALRALEVMAQAQRSPAATALLKAAITSESADDGAGLRSELAAREWGRARGQLLDLLAQSEKPKAKLGSELSKLGDARMRFESDKGATAERAKRYLDIVQAAQDGVRKIPEGLQEDEALMVYRLNSSVALLSVTTRDGTRLFDLAKRRWDGAREVRVASARVGASLRAGEALRVYEKSVLPGAIPKHAMFDFSASHRLYDMVVAPAASHVLSKRHWIVIPDGELAAVPFQMLLSTELPPSPEVSQIQAASWLVRDHSITIAPSVAAMVRTSGSKPSGPLPFLGIGDPVIGDWTPHACDGPLSVADDTRAASGVAATAMFDAALPDTACLLQELAKEAGAGTDDLYVNRRALEASIKQLSVDERLAAYRRIVFATHGLTGGQSNYSEAGLVLTPPGESTANDDGYLSVSEVMALRLNADLVVLSACDSAGGYRDGRDSQASGDMDAGRGSEVFEGLASAFLYAGARHLYVSHWRIEAPAASKLISAAFRTLGTGGGSREYAAALQRAQLDLLQEAHTQGEASPFYWAPLSSVGY